MPAFDEWLYRQFFEAYSSSKLEASKGYSIAFSDQKLLFFETGA